MSKSQSEMKTVQPSQTDPANIGALIANLSNPDGLVRHKARNALVHIGEPAVQALTEALANRDNYTHWQAAKALSLIGSTKSVQTLIETLEDDDFGIRWLAAEGLIAVGYDGLEPLLHALIDHADSVRLRTGAHHITHDLISRELLPGDIRTKISPVLNALEGIEPAVEVPVAAYEALQALRAQPVW